MNSPLSITKILTFLLSLIFDKYALGRQKSLTDEIVYINKHLTEEQKNILLLLERTDRMKYEIEKIKTMTLIIIISNILLLIITISYFIRQ